MSDDKFIKPILIKRFSPISLPCPTHPCSTTLSSGTLKKSLLTLLYPTSTLNPLTVLCALNHPTKDRCMWATLKAPKTLKSLQVTLVLSQNSRLVASWHALKDTGSTILKNCCPTTNTFRSLKTRSSVSMSTSMSPLSSWQRLFQNRM